MIWIDKGPAPALLLGDGEAFQQRARDFETNFVKVAPQKSKPTARGKKRSASQMDDDDAPVAGSQDLLASYVKLTSEGEFNGFESKLFSVFSYYSNPEVKSRLISSHHGKCAFCESFIMDTDVGDVEHYRPKAEVKERDPGAPEDNRTVSDHPGYYWLSQTWENLFLSCKQCNQSFKGNRFDVAPSDVDDLLPRDRVGADGVEQALLLNPGQGVGLNPRNVIRFNPDTAEAEPVQQQGFLEMPSAESTITTVGLNRPRLLESRAAHLVKLRTLFVLAANSNGRLPPGQPVDIRNFSFQIPSAGEDARQGLIDATQPWAEYSALAADAIAAWSTELNMVVPMAFNVGMQQAQQQLTINSNLGLVIKPWIDRHHAYRQAAEARVADQSAPDTTALDTDYNTALATYKAICKRIASDHARLQSIEEDEIAPLEDQLTHLRAQRTQIQQSVIDDDTDDDPLFTVEEGIRKLEKSLEQRQHECDILNRAQMRAYDNKAGAYEGVDSIYDKQRILQIARWTEAARTTQYNESSTAAEQLEQELAEQKQILANMNAATAAHDQEEERLLGLVDSHEHGRSQFFYELFDIMCDASDLSQGYRTCGAPDERRRRAQQLNDAASNMSDFLYALDDPEGDVPSHLVGKSFPPSIRLKS